MSPRVPPGVAHKRPGRPREIRDLAHLHIKVDADQLAVWSAAAVERGLTLSDWVRTELDRAARRRAAKLAP